VLFGATCPTGTVYREPFTSDPIADGTFLPLIGPYAYSPTTSTLSLTSGSPNTQLWIGARPAWTSYTISLSVRIDSSGGNGGITFRMESTPASPGNDDGEMYYAGIGTNAVYFGTETNGTWKSLDGPSASFSVGTFYPLVITAKGSSLSLSAGGTLYVGSFPDSTFTFGSFGLRTYSSGMTYGAITVTCD